MRAERQRDVSQLVGGVVIGAGLGAGLTTLLHEGHDRGSYWYLAVIGALGGVAAVVLAAVLRRPSVVSVPRHGSPPVARVSLEVLGDMERRISSGTRRRIGFLHRLQPVLREL